MKYCYVFFITLIVTFDFEMGKTICKSIKNSFFRRWEIFVCENGNLIDQS